MPQFDLEDTERFKKFLAKKGYTVSEGQELASHLRATQNQLNGVKVAAIAQHFDPKQAVRTVISNDNYILDGHHRWAALIGLAAQKGNFDAMKMDVARINIGIIDLLREAEEFGAKHASFTDFKTASQTGEPTKVQRADAYDPSEPRDESGEWTAGGGAGKHPKAQARLAMWRRAG
jgi:hypothetical protein